MIVGAGEHLAWREPPAQAHSKDRAQSPTSASYPAQSKVETLSSLIRPTALLRPASRNKVGLHSYVSEAKRLMNTFVLILFFCYGSTDLGAMKGIPKQNSECVCVKGGKSPKGIHYSISFLSCPESTNRNMYDTGCLCCSLYRRLLLQTTIYLSCCSPSLFCRQTAGIPRLLKSLNPATQALRNGFCCICASRSLHSPD